MKQMKYTIYDSEASRTEVEHKRQLASESCFRCSVHPSSGYLHLVHLNVGLEIAENFSSANNKLHPISQEL